MDKSTNEKMQEILPGSTTFAANILCPCCGWHFKEGLTDPEGKHTALGEGALLVCGQCLSVLAADANVQLVVLTDEQVDALPEDTRGMLMQSLFLAAMALMMTGPEPKGELQ